VNEVVVPFGAADSLVMRVVTLQFGTGFVCRRRSNLYRDLVISRYPSAPTTPQ